VEWTLNIFGNFVAKDYHYRDDQCELRECQVFDKERCTSSMAAELLGVTPRTVQLWADSGILPSWKTPGGHRRYNLDDVQQLAEQVQRQQKRSPGDLERPLRVQIIEDELALQRLYARTIDSWRLPVELKQSMDGYQGLLELGQFEPDLLILDLNLPNIDGFSVISALHGQGLLQQLQLLVVTARDLYQVQARIDRIVSGVEVLPKPIPFERIKACFEQMLEKNEESA